MRVVTVLAISAATAVLMVSQVSRSAEDTRVEKFMSAYVAALNQGDASKLALSFYDAPLVFTTAEDTTVFSTRNDVRVWAESLIQSLGLKEGARTSIRKLEVCVLNRASTFVRASFERSDATGTTSRVDYLYRLHMRNKSLRIASILALARDSPVGCNSPEMPE